MLRTLVDILRQERADLDERIRREETAPEPDESRLSSLRDEARGLQRQLERMAER